MSHNSTFDDIEDEISSWGYSVSLSDYERSMQLEEFAEIKTNKMAGRGKPVSDDNFMNTVRLASEIHGLNVHPVPMGHLPTTSELLDNPSENEITPLLRKLGISGHDGEISNRKTRQVPKCTEEIRLDRKLPIILNGELFDVPKQADSTVSISEEDEPFDPNRPLQEQFKTIKEFCLGEYQQSQNGESQYITGSGSVSTWPESSTRSSRIVTSELSSDSSSSSATTYSTGEQDSSECPSEPLLTGGGKLYTPRELYRIKRMQPLSYLKALPDASANVKLQIVQKMKTYCCELFISSIV